MGAELGDWMGGTGRAGGVSEELGVWTGRTGGMGAGLGDWMGGTRRAGLDILGELVVRVLNWEGCRC